MSFVLVKGDWARADILIEELSGTAISVDNREIGLDMDEDGTIDVTVSHMGPQRYWEDYGLSYPGPGADLIIKAYDSLSGYVGVSVCYQEDLVNLCIELRDPETLNPLWVLNPATTELSDTSTKATGDCEPIKHDYDYNYYHNYDHNYESPGPNGK